MSVTKVIGFQRSDFTVRGSGESITGYSVFLSRPIEGNDGKGLSAERVYLSDGKLAACGFDLANAVGKAVIVSYNRYGKVQSLAFAD